MEAGELEASSSAPNARPGRAFWLAPGGGLRVQAGASSRLSFHLDGAITRPVFQDRFLFAGEVVHRVPNAAFGIAVGLGLRVP
jgi:hypothetical protein